MRSKAEIIFSSVSAWSESEIEMVFYAENIKLDWAFSLELISTKESVSFYRRHGFEERPCEYDGPGMFKMIR